MTIIFSGIYKHSNYFNSLETKKIFFNYFKKYFQNIKNIFNNLKCFKHLENIFNFK